MSIRSLFLAAVAGGVTAYFFDPTMGTVRRTRLRRIVAGGRMPKARGPEEPREPVAVVSDAP